MDRMDLQSWLTLAPRLMSALGALWLPIKRRLTEYKVSRGVRPSPDLLEPILNETLGRLIGDRFELVWWKEQLRSATHPFLAPDFLRKPAVQEWLGLDQTQTDLKALARRRLMPSGGFSDTETRNRLRAAYSEKTGENHQSADAHVDVVVATLIGSYQSTIDSGSLALAGMLQEASRQSESHFEGIEQVLEEKLGPGIEHIASDAAERELANILKRRGFSIERSRTDISSLAGRVDTGDLRWAARATKAGVYYWAARIFAAETSTIDQSRAYLAQLRSTSPEFDVGIIESLHLNITGEVESALRKVRAIDNPDGRASLFTLLATNKSPSEALSWLDTQEGSNNADFLTGIGWRNVAVSMAQASRWQDAAHVLRQAQHLEEEFPDIAYVDGVIHSAMLLPEEVRSQALSMTFLPPPPTTIIFSDSEEHRSYALARFARAKLLLNELGEEKRAAAADLWRLWLRITSTDQTIAGTARNEVESAMKDGKLAGTYLPFALAFNVKFDPSPLRSYLTELKRLGGLEPRDTISEMMLLQSTVPLDEFLEFLRQDEQRLVAHVPKHLIARLRVEALIDVKEWTKAKRVLEDSRAVLSPETHASFEALIVANERGDPRHHLEEAFRLAPSLHNLKELVACLGKASDWKALAPLAEELFRREPNIQNARQVIACYERVRPYENPPLVSFFERNPNVANWDLDCKGALANAYFSAGRLEEARVLIRELRRVREKSVDMHLAINLAVVSGDWESFSGIIEQQWERRNQLGADTLMRLATLAVEVDVGVHRAMQLAKLAVEKAPNDPNILVGAYTLAVHLGVEGPVESFWIARAVELSSGKGPVWSIKLETVAKEWIPAHRAKTEAINRDVLSGGLMLHLAASALNVPLSQVLLASPRDNERQTDGRLRGIVPIASGARHPVAGQSNWIVGFDETTIMVLVYLDLLSVALGAFDQIVLSPDTIPLLLEERRRALYHQPSVVKQAEEILELINQNVLTPHEIQVSPPQWLREEVGDALAELIEIARANGGHLVHPRPLPKSMAFGEQAGDLRDYDHLVATTVDLCNQLHDAGRVSREAYDRARAWLDRHDKQGEGATPRDLLTRPIYLDDLTLQYLHHAGLLEGATHSGLSFRVHPSTQDNLRRLVAANRNGTQLASSLDAARIVLRDQIASGHAILLPRHGPSSERERVVLAVEYFLMDLGPGNAICLDDRALNQHGNIQDQSGKAAKVLNTVDILRFLETTGRITRSSRLGAIHRLRAGGFGMIPVTVEEVEELLRNAQFDEEGKLRESRELKVFRQTFNRIFSLDMIDPAIESPYLDSLVRVALQVIRKIWADESIPPERAAVLSSWVWNNVYPQHFMSSSKTPAAQVEGEVKAREAHVALLAMSLPQISDARSLNYQAWVQFTVLNPISTANPRAAARIIQLVKEQIIRLSDEHSETTRTGIGREVTDQKAAEVDPETTQQ